MSELKHNESVVQSTIHHTELPEDNRGDASARDWNFYRQEVGRLLAEGQEGRWVLIKGAKIIGIWESRDEAAALALERYLNEAVLIHQIQENEPILRVRGYNLPWPTFSLQLAKPA